MTELAELTRAICRELGLDSDAMEIVLVLVTMARDQGRLDGQCPGCVAGGRACRRVRAGDLQGPRPGHSPGY